MPKLEVYLRFMSIWLFFNYPIRLVIESFMDITLTSLINLKELNMSKSGETTGSILSLIFFATMFMFSFSSSILSQKIFKKGIKNSMRIKALLEGITLKNKS